MIKKLFSHTLTIVTLPFIYLFLTVVFPVVVAKEAYLAFVELFNEVYDKNALKVKHASSHILVGVILLIGGLFITHQVVQIARLSSYATIDQSGDSKIWVLDKWINPFTDQVKIVTEDQKVIEGRITGVELVNITAAYVVNTKDQGKVTVSFGDVQSASVNRKKSACLY